MVLPGFWCGHVGCLAVRLSGRVVAVGAFLVPAGVDLWLNFRARVGHCTPGQGYVRLSGEFHGPNSKSGFLLTVLGVAMQCERRGSENFFGTGAQH